MRLRRRQLAFDRVAGGERHSRFMPAVARQAFRLPLTADCWPPGYGGGEASYNELDNPPKLS